MTREELWQQRLAEMREDSAHYARMARMSDGNGHEPTGLPVAAALMPPPLKLEPRTAAQLSSVERNALLDGIVEDLTNLGRAHNGLNTQSERLFAEHRAMLDAHAGVVNRPTFWQRLRWLVLGL